MINLFEILIFAGLANMTPPLVVPLFPKMNTPLDCGHSFKGTRIFGDHKTWRGLIMGTLISGLAWIIYSSLTKTDPNLFLGFQLGFGALMGDAIKSFFKRRVGVKSGQSWFPFDQIDWVIGASLMVINQINFLKFLLLLILGLGLHLIVKLLGYLLKINPTII